VTRAPGDVARALARLASDPELRERLGLEARKRALAFTPQRWASATVAAYDRLLEQPPKPRGD
jgi:glycosyltransferase involved in cell wall biosynthesis